MTFIMSSKRSTNNSVSSLGDQNSIISALSTEGGLLAEVSSQTSSDKKKSGKSRSSRRAAEAGQNGGRSGSGEAAPGNAAPGSDVTGPRPTAGTLSSHPATVTTSSVTNSVAGGHVTLATSADAPPMAGALPNLGMSTNMAQPWMWPFGFQPYGNFVPNYSFGDIAQPDWDPEEEVVLPGERQANHEISEEEEELEEEPRDLELEELPGPPQKRLDLSLLKGDGKIVRLLKEQLTHVKEADKVSPEIGEEMAALLEKYLEEAHGLAELERLTHAPVTYLT